MATKKIFLGRFVHCKSLSELQTFKNGAIGVDDAGKIAWIVEDAGADVEAEGLAKQHGWATGEYQVITARGDGFFFPGFIDTHIHASQYPNAGVFGNSTLLDWLNTYTFPLEASLADLEKARKVYDRVVSRTLSNGTTTASYYATNNVGSTNLLADICLDKGQRAYVGRCCMDSDIHPDWYRDATPEEALQNDKSCIEHIRKIDPEHKLVTPIITPRFAPSCTHQTLQSLGTLHAETGYPLQTHISENKNEVELVKQLFPGSESYAAVYDEAGLLTEKMILAHAVHLTDSERALIKARKAKISHCPTSNTALTSGCVKVRKYLNEGLDVSLGTDVSGGFTPSLLEVARQAIWVSRFVAMTDGDAAKLTPEEGLYLATRGGAKAVGLEDRIGGFGVGMDWDVQLVRLGRVGGEGDQDGPVDIFGWEKEEDVMHKWFYGGDDRNTVAVWVKGRLVHQAASYKPR